MALLKGITVILYDRVKTGVDDFGDPIYKETAITVDNVLVCPANTGDIVTDFQLYGKFAEYELLIPKEDIHSWEDRTVEFYGEKWKTFGIPQRWVGANVPGPWNLKVKVERYA